MDARKLHRHRGDRAVCKGLWMADHREGLCQTQPDNRVRTNRDARLHKMALGRASAPLRMFSMTTLYAAESLWKSAISGPSRNVSGVREIRPGARILLPIALVSRPGSNAQRPNHRSYSPSNPHCWGSCPARPPRMRPAARASPASKRGGVRGRLRQAMALP